MDEVEVKTYRSPVDTKITYAITVNDMVMDQTAHAVLRLICNKVAERYVEEHYPEIAAKLDQNAIANLAIAEASKKIAEEIQRQPNIIETTNKEIYQRGIFGGMRRVR